MPLKLPPSTAVITLSTVILLTSSNKKEVLESIAPLTVWFCSMKKERSSEKPSPTIKPKPLASVLALVTVFSISTIVSVTNPGVPVDVTFACGGFAE